MDGTEPETCAKCGFDSRRWRRRDAADLFQSLGWWWEHATAGYEAEILNRRPAPKVWSVLEYGLHTALAVAVIRCEVEQILAEDGRVMVDEFDIGDATEDNWARIDRASMLGDLVREGAAMAALARREGAPWANIGRFEEMAVQAEAYLIHDAHDASHHFFDTAHGLTGLAAHPGEEGRVAQINVSHGGVPKRSVPNATVTTDGILGDRQADSKHHGRPFQAVCLWSAEVIGELAGMRHPIAAGSAGENLTLAGLDWTTMRPGMLLRVGEALIELSFPATPCQKQSQWFADGDVTTISYDVNPQWSRWYGWVRVPGDIAVDAPVVVGG